MRPSKIWVVSDTHFGHNNIIKYSPERSHFKTIEEHDEQLIDNWNSVVRSQDVVYHLGDFCFGKDRVDIAGQLRGNKKLVLGNHDTYDINHYLKYFVKIHGSVALRRLKKYGVLLTHIPVSTSQFPRFDLNIHGHTHSRNLEDTRYVNVSVEQTNLAPVELDQIIEERING